MTPTKTAPLKGKQGKRLKIVLVAVVAMAAFIYMRRGSTPASTADTGVPLTDSLSGGGLAAGADSAAAAGALSGDPQLTDLQNQLANFAGSVNDRFGHFSDLEDAYGTLKAGGDPWGAVPATDQWGDPASTGAGDPTSSGRTPVAMPGNAKATAGAKSVRQLAQALTKVKRGGGEAPPKATLAQPPKTSGKGKKKKKTTTKPTLFGWTQVSGSRGSPSPTGSGGGVSGLAAVISGGTTRTTQSSGRTTAPIQTATRTAAPATSVRLPGGGGGYIAPSPLRAINLAATKTPVPAPRPTARFI